MPALLNRMSIRPKRVDGRVHGGRDGRVVAHVGGEGEALDAELRGTRAASESRSADDAHRVARVAQRPRDVERAMLRALAGERERGGAPLAVRGAGDERHPAR